MKLFWSLNQYFPQKKNMQLLPLFYRKELYLPEYLTIMTEVEQLLYFDVFIKT